MNLDTLVQFHNDLVRLDDSKIAIVTYEDDLHLTYHQFGMRISIPYMDNYFIPKKFKYGILLPNDLRKMKETLELIIQDPKLKIGDLNTNLLPLRLELYSLFKGLVGPQLTYELEFCSIINSFITKIVIMTSDAKTRLLFKSIKNEKRRNKNN